MPNCTAKFSFTCGAASAHSFTTFNTSAKGFHARSLLNSDHASSFAAVEGGLFVPSAPSPDVLRVSYTPRSSWEKEGRRGGKREEEGERGGFHCTKEPIFRTSEWQQKQAPNLLLRKEVSRVVERSCILWWLTVSDRYARFDAIGGTDIDRKSWIESLQIGVIFPHELPRRWRKRRRRYQKPSSLKLDLRGCTKERTS